MKDVAKLKATKIERPVPVEPPAKVVRRNAIDNAERVIRATGSTALAREIIEALPVGGSVTFSLDDSSATRCAFHLANRLDLRIDHYAGELRFRRVAP